MIIKLRLGQGKRVAKKRGTAQKFALAVASLLVPVCVIAWFFTVWRIGADLGITGGFAVETGLLSHWQVWLTIAVVLNLLIVWLNRFGHRGDHAVGASLPDDKMGSLR